MTENFDYSSNEIINQIKNLITSYENRVTFGVLFKLNENEYPLELLKVINLIKDKIKRWNNDTIFTYYGKLFKKKRVIVIGAGNIEQAIDLIVFIYLSDLIKSKDLQVEKFKPKEFEEALKAQIRDNIEEGYRFSKDIEEKIKSHIQNILNEQTQL